MRVVFAGTPAFATPSLQALLARGHRVEAVFSQPDRPAGRGRQLVAPAVAALARAHGLPLLQPPRLDAEAQARLRALAPDVMVVVAYGLILPAAVLAIPRLGCLNVHASLLPRWRGAAPVARAIEAGDDVTGVCIMQMDAGLDTGPVLACEPLAIPPEASAGELAGELAQRGAALLVPTLDAYAFGGLSPTPQASTGATYAKKLEKEAARIDWSRPAPELARLVRALNPAPVAWSDLEGERIRVWRAVARAGDGGAPGTVVAAGPGGLCVACGSGQLVLTELQRPGGKALPAQAWMRGDDFVGRHFG